MNTDPDTDLFSITSCPVCGSSALRWIAEVKNTSGVQDGRLRLHEAANIFVLGCDVCSETVKVVFGDLVGEFLTKLLCDRTWRADD